MIQRVLVFHCFVVALVAPCCECVWRLISCGGAFAVGMSGLQLPASQSLHALSRGQNRPPLPATTPPGGGTSQHDQSGFRALLHVSTSDSAPALTCNPTAAAQRCAVPVSGQHNKGLRSVTSACASSAVSPRGLTVATTSHQVTCAGFPTSATTVSQQQFRTGKYGTGLSSILHRAKSLQISTALLHESCCLHVETNELSEFLECSTIRFVEDLFSDTHFPAK